MTNQRICVGAIVGAFGVRGELRVKSFCADPEALGDYSPLFSEDGQQQFVVTILHPIKGGFSARVDSVFNKEDADLLRGIKLYAERSALPGLPDDEFYHADLIGLDVLDTGGEQLGQITNVVNHGAADLLEVLPDRGSDTVLVPFTLSAVPTVDLQAKRVIIDPPEGIFDR